MANDSRGRPLSSQTIASWGSMKNSPAKARTDVRKMSPDANSGLGVARVTNLDYEGLYVTLKTLLGASEVFERVPVPLTFPGAGARSFFGSMPEIGDYCIIGWMPQETMSNVNGGGTKIPIILRWIVPGVWPARDWLLTAEFEADEFDQSVPKNQMKGAYDRIRHKLRHMQPGGVLASSSQGSDLVLDEGVLLANRRGNEFRLRDQDQAAVTRALQRFDALAGVRVYAGMVQRDANILYPTMVSDGKLWDGPLQAKAGIPLKDSQLPDDPNNPQGFLTPAKILQRRRLTPDEGYLGRDLLNLNARLDPYTFLRQGGFIDQNGYAVLGVDYDPDVIYGGKPIFRVANQSRENAAGDADKPTLTEYRLDITHTSDGRLPVTEQTDMFDAERLPDEDPANPKNKLPSNQPFIEWVMGSVIGNDAFSDQGRAMYGLPLKAIIFDGDVAKPHLEPAIITSEVSGISSTPLKEQAATLFKMTPPIEEGGDPTFWSVNKQGQLKVSLAGPSNENSLEAYLSGNARLGVRGDINTLINGGVQVTSQGSAGIGISALQGAVHIFGASAGKNLSAGVTRTMGQGDETLPSLSLEGQTNTLVKAGKTVFIQGQDVTATGSGITLTAQDTLALNGVKQIQVNTECLNKVVGGKESESWNGPKGGLPTNGAVHERTYNAAGGTAEKVVYVSGNREEEFKAGSHSTTVLVGSMEYSVKAGSWKVSTATSSLELGPLGIEGTAKLGSVELKALAGSTSMMGMTSVTVEAVMGQVTLKGTRIRFTPHIPSDTGGVLTSGSRDPLTGSPFKLLGTLGALGVVVE